MRCIYGVQIGSILLMSCSSQDFIASWMDDSPVPAAHADLPVRLADIHLA